MPAVSVIIPVYNTAPYLQRCLESVTGQTLRGIEIICIDDGSTDNSLALLKQYAAQDARIRVIAFDANRGASAARNAGLAAATGEFIGFVDSDDFIDACYYDKLYRAALKNNADIAKCSYYNDDSSKKKKQLRYNKKIAQKKFYFSINFTTAIYRVSMLSEHGICFPDGIKNYEDVVFLIKAVYHASTVAIVNDAYYHYMQRTDSASQLHVSKLFVKETLSSYLHIIEFINTVPIRRDHYNHIFLQILESISWATGLLDCVPESLAGECLHLLRMYKYLPPYMADLEVYLSKTRKPADRLSCLRDDFHHSAVKKNTTFRIRRLYLKSTQLTVCLHVGSLNSGGAERQIVHLARGLSRAGANVYVFCTFLGGAYSHYQPLLSEAGIPVLNINPGDKEELKELLVLGAGAAKKEALLAHQLRSLPSDFVSLLRLTGLLAKLSPDILHCYLDMPNCLGGYAGSIAGTPGIVLSGRSVNPVVAGYELAHWAKPAYTSLLARPNVIMEANSGYGAASYANWLERAPESIAVNHNGIELASFTAAPEARRTLRATLGVGELTPVVLCLARFNHLDKRPADMLAVFATLRTRMPEARLFVAGQDMDWALEMGAMVKERGMQEHVCLLGRREDVADLLAASDILLSTSKNEGFPNAVMEAMNAGLPIVATGVGGVPELVRHETDGFLHPVGDIAGMAESLARILGDRALKKQMGDKAQKRVRANFSLDKLVERTLERYAELLNRVSAATPDSGEDS